MLLGPEGADGRLHNDLFGDSSSDEDRNMGGGGRGGSGGGGAGGAGLGQQGGAVAAGRAAGGDGEGPEGEEAVEWEEVEVDAEGGSGGPGAWPIRQEGLQVFLESIGSRVSSWQAGVPCPFWQCSTPGWWLRRRCLHWWL